MTTPHLSVISLSGSEDRMVSLDVDEKSKSVRLQKSFAPNYGYSSPVKDCFRSVLCEFIGCTIFVFVGSLAVTISSNSSIVGIALAHGVCIAVLIAGMGHISGGHFNPAVTLGVLISGNIPVINAVAYMISQLLGGFLGALFVRAVLPQALYTQGVSVTGVPLLFHEYPMQPITGEIIFTYLLVSTVLLTAVDQGMTLAPLAIGLSITVDILAGGGVSGASMNPARSFGPVIVQSLFGYNSWALHYVDWVGPAIGATIAGVVYKAFLAKDKRWLL